jgi:hypothetical protein
VKITFGLEQNVEANIAPSGIETCLPGTAISNESSDVEDPPRSRKFPEQRAKSTFLGCDPPPSNNHHVSVLSHRDPRDRPEKSRSIPRGCHGSQGRQT